MEIESRKVSDSIVETVHMVRPQHLNASDRLFGGALMQWIDEVAGMVAKRHTRRNVITASVDSLSFLRGAYVKDTVVIIGKVTYVGNTSMEVKVDTYVEALSGERTPINHAYFTMVALDKNDKPVRVPRLDLETEEEKEELISKEPQAISFIRHYMMGKDFIDRKPRYCIWLVGADPSLLKRCPLVRERIDKVREFRMASTRNNTRKAADTPGLFASILEYDSPYIAIPKVSSQNRRYIPMDYLDGEIIPGDKLFTMPSATSYEFGILMSNVHMAWTRVVCGRLKSDYSYSNTIVYNNFPWPSPTDEQKEKIKKTAQAILNARALYPNSSLADLYDPLTMPPELLKAHNANNRAVMEAYGFSTKMSEADCVAELMKMYQKLTEEK